MKIILILFALSSLALGQVSSGCFYGEVRDQSTALVSGAQIAVIEEKTGFQRKTVSSANGSYRVPDLIPGVYTVTAERQGFRQLVIKHATLEISQNARVDLRLELGPAHDAIAVNSTLSPIQTDDTSEGVHFDAELLKDLPSDGRNILSFVTVAPGAIPRQLGGYVHDGDNDVQESSRGAVAFNPPINGSRPSDNSYLIDGANNTDRNTFSAVVIPPLDSVQEFRVQTSLAAATFMQASGGVIDIATKSGSKDFRGDVFEFLRNEATDAHNYFDDPTLPRPLFRRNQYGGSLGGPLGLKSTFFFLSYEGLRSKSASSSRQLVPDATYRSGDFAGDATIYDPLSLNAGGVRTPFAQNLLPPSRIDPIAGKYLALYEPLPNRSDISSSNYLDSTPSVSNNDSGSVRLDHQFQRFGQIFGRYTINNEPGDFAGSFPLRPTSEKLRAQQISLGHTFATTRAVNEFRASFTRLALFDAPQSAFHSNEAAALGLDNPPTDPFAFGLPYFFVTDFSTVTDDPTLPQIQRDNVWSFSDSFTVVHGRHTWAMGVNWSPFQMNYQQSNLIRGKYTYTGAYTADPLTSTGGEALADFLLGYPLTTQRTVGSPLANLRQKNFGLFVQHNWHPTSALSVTLGLRYEYDSPFTEQSNKFLNLDYSTLPAQPELKTVHYASDPNRLNFSPRVGVAWKLPGLLSHGGDSVFRAGYGIYYNPEIADEAYDLVLNGIQTQINETSGLGLPLLTTKDGFQNSSVAGFPSYFGLDQQAPTPNVQQWNAGFERNLPGQVLLEASYVASKGTHLGVFRRFNTPLHSETGEDLSPRPGDLQSLRTFPELGTIFQRQHIGNSSYQSLQLKAEKRFRHSLTFLVSFVWSKSIDDADNIVVGLYDSAGAQNENNLRLERGLSFDNIPRRLSADFVYNLPSLHALGPVVRNWRLNGVITLQDGTPLNPFYIASDFANTGTPNRPNVVPGQSISLPSSERTPDHWFNTAAFSTPAPYTFGDAGRNIIPGPGNEVTDLALARRFSVKERFSLELRADAFNIFNHPNYGIPGPYPDLGPFFGKIFSAGSPRRIQFGARFDF